MHKVSDASMAAYFVRGSSGWHPETCLQAAVTMATVWIPPLMRDLTAGRESVVVAGTTVRDIIDALERAHPGIKSRLCADDSLRPGVAVAVDGITSPIGLLQTVRPRSEVHFVAAIGGG